MGEFRFEEPSRTEDRLSGHLRQLHGGVTRFAPVAFLVILLIACWTLGGASQNNALLMALLELIALTGLTILLFFNRAARLFPEGRSLLLMLASFAVLVILQLVPLPWAVWSALPGHGAAARASELLDLPRTSHPLSLAPERSVSAVLKFIPAIAVFLAALALHWRVLFGIAQIGATAAGVLSSILGFSQIVAGARLPLHLYGWGNVESATGLFANANHQAVFLLMCLPFVAVLAGKALAGWRSGRLGLEVLVLMAAAGLITLAGIAIAGSFSGYILAPFVVACSAFLLTEKLTKVDPKLIAGGLALTAGAIALALVSPQLQGVGQGNYFGGERARSAIHAHSLEAAIDFLPLGSGLGSFERVYPFYEEENAIEESFVNHAHNEYLELVLELGLPGLAILISFIVWWTRETWTTWAQPEESTSFKRVRMAATIALAVVLIHSLLEFSIRTATISAFAAVCLAIMSRRRGFKQRRAGTSVALRNAPDTYPVAD